MEIRKRKTPERRCVGCGETKEKKQLIRVVRTPEGEVILDATGKKSGRGAYLCRNISCFRKARKSKRLESGLSVQIPEEIYERLEKELLEEKK